MKILKNKKSKNNETPQEKAFQAVNAFVNEETEKIDPTGSYTGNPTTKKETPTQDVDEIGRAHV